jgi:SAM-dependent methyltransferase
VSAELEELKGLAVSSLVGLSDDALAGWYNYEKGELASGFPIDADDVVLDVGCGNGGMATFCARRGARIILIDSNESKIREARARLSSYPQLRLQTHVSDAHRLPLATGSVNRIICTEVLEHVDDPAAVMAELLRVGRPGALYFLTVPGTALEMLQKRLAHPGHFEKPNHIRIFEPQTFAELVRSSGLTIERTTSHGFFWSLWMALFWQTGVPLSDAASHPSLDYWARTWAEVLKGDQARLVQRVLNEFLPSSQVIIARKPLEVASGDAGPTFFEVTKHLRDADPCDERVLAHLKAQIGRRFDRAGLQPHPALPQCTDLRMRREGLPDWWAAGNNVLLASPNTKIPDLKTGYFGLPLTRNTIVVMGGDVVVHHLSTSGDGGLVVLGDTVNLYGTAVNTMGDCTLLVGERTTATLWAHIDARNTGLVCIGADGMWASDVHVTTDDCHAVRDVATGKRINKMGGVIVVGPHVWLCLGVHLLGDCRIGADSVVGLRSMVKDMELPANSVCAGWPARIVRTGVTWDRQDLP